MPTERDILTAAAHAALPAPSPLNTQPWTWYVEDHALELYADRDRQLTVADPDGRFLLLSCGIAAQHAATNIAAAGYTPLVEPLVTAFGDNHLARITLGPPRPPEPADLAADAAMRTRRSDRRPFADRIVPAPALQALITAAETHGARLHVVGLGQMPMLAIAVAQAGAAELSDPAYRNELMRWTNRPRWSGDGVPAGTTVQRVPRRVPVRELALDPYAGRHIEPGGDRGAAYLILHGSSDLAADWFAAGWAAAEVLLTATTLGLATAPITDALEVPHPRSLVTGLLPHGGHPYLIVRCGWSDQPDDLAPSPRRELTEVIIQKETS